MKHHFSTKKSCLIASVFSVICFGLIVFVLLAVRNINFETGGYTIDQVIVSNEREGTQLAVDNIIFHPSDTIFCTVRTIGVDGIIGMRWFFEGEIISEGIGKTENNSISSYIKPSSPEGLPEGSYHVEIFIVENQPIETVHFQVKN